MSDEQKQAPYTAALKNGQRIVVAPARAADAADLLQFLNRVGGESDNLLFGPGAFELDEEQEARFLQQQAALPGCVVLLGRVGGAAAAVASLAAPQRQRIAHTAELSIVVGKEHWGQGAGGAMMQALLAWARAAGTLRFIHLGVRADNRVAIGLYRRFGFAEAGRYKNYFCVGGHYCDQLLMALEL